MKRWAFFLMSLPFILSSCGGNSLSGYDYHESKKLNTSIFYQNVGQIQAADPHVISHDGKYYLYGYSEEREAVRIFSLGRIENLTITEKTFKLPKKFEFSNKCGNGRFGTFISENTDKYKIEFYDFSRPMVKSSIWADDQVLEDDEKRNCTTITFTSTQTVKVEEWVLSQGMYAKPLEPEWLVNTWKEHVKNMCRMAKL